MGTFYVQGRLSHQRQRRLQRNLRFLVDTGAFFSVVPREILFGNPEKVQPRISPDGKRLAYIAPLDGVLNVWVGDIVAVAG